MSDILRPSASEAQAAWRARVRANADQVERFREVPDPTDFYGPVSTFFRADPRRTDEPILERLRALARTDEAWLDIGAGAGRYALPLALLVREVIAVEPSAGMTAALREGMAEHGISNIQIVEGGWPPDAPTTGVPIPNPPRGDVALIANLGYDIAEIGPFLHAMESAADRLCAAVLMVRQPSSIAEPFWPIVHGEERVALPALPEFLTLLSARARSFEVALADRPPRSFESFEAMAGFIRRQLWIAEDGKKDRRFLAALRELAAEDEDGWRLATQRPLPVGLATWAPLEHRTRSGLATHR